MGVYTQIVFSASPGWVFTLRLYSLLHKGWEFSSIYNNLSKIICHFEIINHYQHKNGFYNLISRVIEDPLKKKIYIFLTFPHKIVCIKRRGE